MKFRGLILVAVSSLLIFLFTVILLNSLLNEHGEASKQSMLVLSLGRTNDEFGPVVTLLISNRSSHSVILLNPDVEVLTNGVSSISEWSALPSDGANNMQVLPAFAAHSFPARLDPIHPVRFRSRAVRAPQKWKRELQGLAQKIGVRIRAPRMEELVWASNHQHPGSDDKV